MRSISTDYSQNPQQNVSFFSYIFVFHCQFESAHVALWRLTKFPSNNVNASLVPILARQLYSRLNVLRLHFFRTFSMVFNYRSLFKEAAYLAALHRLCSPFAIRNANSKQSKTKIYENTHLSLRISAVIGRYRPHLMIVMIFVTQNNF